MKKLISVLLMLCILEASFAVVFAAEPELESVSIIETNNNGYLDLDLNIEDETVGDLYGIQRSENVPEKFSSVLKGNVTSVKNQRSASCWAYAAVASLETDVLTNFDDATLMNTSFSSTHLAWFTYTAPKSDADNFYGEYFNIGSISPYEYGGNWNRAAATLANFRGIANSSIAVYEKSLDESIRYSASSGYVLKDAIVLDTAADVKSWIMEHGACYLSYYQESGSLNSKTGAYNYTGSNASNHAITIVGWDDNYSKTNFKKQPSSNGAWLCKNSYGTSYTSIGGYMWISYEDTGANRDNSFFGFSAQKNIYNNNYSYNNISYTNYFPMNNTATAANVFTATDDEEIAAVAFHTMNKNLDVTIRVYTDIPENAKNPDEGTLATTYTTELTNVGFHTVTLGEKVEIENGSKFSIVITLEGNGEIGLPIEKNTSSTVVTGDVGESFFFHNNTWKDCRNYGSGSYRNVFINALTVKEDTNDIANETETVIENEPETEIEPQSEIEPETKVEPETDVEPETEDEPQTEVETETEVEPQAEVKTHKLITEVKTATCTTPGYKKVYCEECGEVESYEVTTASHSYKATVTRPTCTEKGYTTYTCSCGHSYKSDYTAANGHNFYRVGVVKETSSGTVYETRCRCCGAVSKETVKRNFVQSLVWFLNNLFKTK